MQPLPCRAISASAELLVITNYDLKSTVFNARVKLSTSGSWTGTNEMNYDGRF